MLKLKIDNLPQVYSLLLATLLSITISVNSYDIRGEIFPEFADECITKCFKL